MTLKELKAAVKEAKAKMAEARATCETAKAEAIEAEAAAKAASIAHGKALVNCNRIAREIEVKAAAIKVLGWTEDERAALVGAKFNELVAPTWAVQRRAAIKISDYRSPRWASAFVDARAILRGVK